MDEAKVSTIVKDIISKFENEENQKLEKERDLGCTMENETIEIANENNNDDDDSLSSITSMTMTASSQTSQRSLKSSPTEINGDENIHGLIENLKTVLQKMKVKTETTGSWKEVTSAFLLCDKLETQCKLEMNSSKHFHRISTDELLNQLQIANDENIALLSRVEELKNKCSELKEVQHANQLLNNYISDADTHHSREIGELKAKLSLTRIANEINDSDPEKPDKNKKQRRSSSSVLFWRKKSSSSLENESSKLESGESMTNETLKAEYENKCIKIEELKTQCDDLERRSTLLETTLQNKTIEISNNKKVISTLHNKIKSLSTNNNQSCTLLHEINKVLQATSKELSHLEKQCLENREMTQQYYEKLERLDWNIKSLSEENKILLSKFSHKNYVLKLEQVKYETFVQELKTLVSEMYKSTAMDDSYQVDVEKQFKENGIRALFELIKHMSTTLPSTNHISDQSNHVDLDDMQNTSNCQQGEIDASSSQHPMKRKVCDDQKGKSPSSIKKEVTTIGEQNDSKFLKEFVSYVEYAKDKEIYGYKMDISNLHRENYQLKESLSQCYDRLLKLETEIKYKKSIEQEQNFHKSSSVPAQENWGTIPKVATTPHSNMKLEQKIIISPDKYRKLKTANQGNSQSMDITESKDDELFLNSFRAGSTLINEIFHEKDQLERQLAQSRDIVIRRKKSTL